MPEELLASPNAALLQDDLLYNIVQVVEGDYPIGPVFMHALNTLVEAAVLHEISFFNVGWDQAGEGSGLDAVVWESPFIQNLVSNGLLARFPKTDAVDKRLEQLSSSYDTTDFLKDQRWQLQSFCFSDIDQQRQHLYRVAVMLSDFPGVFQSKTLTDSNDMPVERDAIRLVEMGMPIENIILLEGHNHMVDGYVQLTKQLRLNLYLVETAMPHHMGAIHRANSKVRELYEELLKNLGQLEPESIGNNDINTVAIPDLTKIVLKDSKNDLKAISHSIMSLRDRHRGFRKYLTEFDASWRTAKTKRQRVELQSAFDNAWKRLSESEHKPKERWFYKLWDILKKPTDILAALGDRFAAKGRDETILGQVRGLTAIRKDLLDAPLVGDTLELLTGFRHQIADPEIWKDAASFGAGVQSYFMGKADRR